MSPLESKSNFDSFIAPASPPLSLLWLKHADCCRLGTCLLLPGPFSVWKSYVVLLGLCVYACTGCGDQATQRR